MSCQKRCHKLPGHGGHTRFLASLVAPLQAIKSSLVIGSCRFEFAVKTANMHLLPIPLATCDPFSSPCIERYATEA